MGVGCIPWGTHIGASVGDPGNSPSIGGTQMGASVGVPGNSPSIGGTQMGASIGDPGNSPIRGVWNRIPPLYRLICLL